MRRRTARESSLVVCEASRSASNAVLISQQELIDLAEDLVELARALDQARNDLFDDRRRDLDDQRDELRVEQRALWNVRPGLVQCHHPVDEGERGSVIRLWAMPTWSGAGTRDRP
jgi:hypothetical protein